LIPCEVNISENPNPAAMKKQIIQSINDPEALEKLFRKDKSSFTRDFPEASAGVDNELVRFWQIRLKNESPGQKHGLHKKDLWIVAILSFVIALLVKAHLLFGNMTMEEFWFRNLCTIAFAGLTTWFILKNRITGVKNLLLFAFPVVILTIFMNLLPDKQRWHLSMLPCSCGLFLDWPGFPSNTPILRRCQVLSAITESLLSCTGCYASLEPFSRE
jgi:hypothetical protein